MPLIDEADGVDAVAMYVQWHLQPTSSAPPRGDSNAARTLTYASPYRRHEVFFLPRRRHTTAPLEFAASVEAGALRLDFGRRASLGAGRNADQAECT